jgi:hypothetical protein
MFVKRGLKNALVACADGISQINAACFRRKGWGQAGDGYCHFAFSP